LPRFGSDATKRNAVIAAIQEEVKGLSKRAVKNIENTYYNDNQSHIHEDEAVMINLLSWDKIEKAEGKSRGIAQRDLMGSASEVNLINDLRGVYVDADASRWPLAL
jgi:hypothetical protein